MSKDLDLLHYALAKSVAECKHYRNKSQELYRLIEGILSHLDDDPEYEELVENVNLDLERIYNLFKESPNVDTSPGNAG